SESVSDSVDNQTGQTGQVAASKQKSFFRRQLPLESETNFFILANALDVYLTYLLLRTHAFRESNEIANRILNQFGFNGMIAFKFGMVAFVCVVTQIIATKRLNTARFVLYLGIVIVLGVVIYSANLYYQYRFVGPQPI
ncbi:MAG: DUF5658 family protein, partial [Planctomycetota bacterium]